MLRVNLIPERRVEARKARIRVRWWLAVCSGACSAMFIGLILMHTLGGVNQESLQAKAAHTTSLADEIRGEVETLDRELTSINARISANLAVGGQPDWSILLALLSDTMGDEIALSDLRLGRSGDLSAPSLGGGRGRPTRPAGNDASSSSDLTIGGLGQNQNAVVHFALRLEETDLFNEVRLVDTQRQPYRDGYAVSFRLECSMEHQP